MRKRGGPSTADRACRFCKNVQTAAGKAPVCGITGAKLTADEYFWSSNGCINWKLKLTNKPKKNETIADALF